MNRAPFIVMELLTGMDLDNLIENMGPLNPTASGARLPSGVPRPCCGARALDASSGIKPANIFLDTKPSGEVIVKICQTSGIAKRSATEAINQSTAGLTATGGSLGSPVYMSPEQARNAKHVDHAHRRVEPLVSMYEALRARDLGAVHDGR